MLNATQNTPYYFGKQTALFTAQHVANDYGQDDEEIELTALEQCDVTPTKCAKGTK